jgi:hypothetical protein
MPDGLAGAPIGVMNSLGARVREAAQDVEEGWSTVDERLQGPSPIFNLSWYVVALAVVGAVALALILGYGAVK